MMWELDWHFVAERDLRSIPSVDAATRLDAAILHFAATNRGPVRRVVPQDPKRLRLEVPGAVALLYADADTGILVVWRVFRRRT
jgi:hypothetical protein